MILTTSIVALKSPLPPSLQDHIFFFFVVADVFEPFHICTLPYDGKSFNVLPLIVIEINDYGTTEVGSGGCDDW